MLFGKRLVKDDNHGEKQAVEEKEECKNGNTRTKRTTVVIIVTESESRKTKNNKNNNDKEKRKREVSRFNVSIRIYKKKEPRQTERILLSLNFHSIGRNLSPPFAEDIVLD